MSDNIQKDPQVILCDMCTEEDRKPARKTCMKCEISMCVQHLQAHLTTPVLLQTHPLTEPISVCGTTKCPQHGKLLEYYCLDDMTFVCVSCAIDDQHRLHNMKTFSMAHKELMEKLKAEQQVKTDDENVSLEKWEKSEREKLGHSSVRLIEAVTKLRDMALTSVQSSVSARMTSLKNSKNSMQAAQNEKDTYRFLQMYSQVHQDVEKAKAVALRKGLEPGADRDKLVKEMRESGEKMVKQADDLWGSLMTLVDPENHQELLPTTSEEDRKPARKTCMKCEISMCVQHLQAHLTTPVLLQTHPLTDPMSACGTTKCPQHGKLLEYYCLDDMTCVCVSCAIEDQHRLHNMKTFSTAHKELMEKLNAEQLALLVKTDDENASLEKWEKSEREKLGRSSVRLIEAVTKLRDMALTSVQSSVSARMTSLKTSKNSMQAAQNEKDTYRFLQMYSQVRQDVEKAKAVDLRKGIRAWR
ncbi:hypothetical protein D5F01_LYC22803 [Larimichthys crocea]|uniref:B box-type domain-containing protein n=1 Tax=Larimichthys crocea TaxID=215358 RepID=A0A6G0HJJ3_LARCR|nr:hypothetical protein D5F01_LYC22803 [Larimichthys crocea]